MNRDFQERIWQVVSQIPAGKVAGYGQVADLAGLTGKARLVGRILSQLPADSTLPWHRVINSRGEISTSGNEQVQRLLAEGITPINGKISWKHYRWRP